MFSIFKYFQKSSISPNNKKFLIVGLGNIGEEYTNTRHNIGFDIVDQLGRILKGTFNAAKYGDILKSKYAGKQIILLKPKLDKCDLNCAGTDTLPFLSILFS